VDQRDSLSRPPMSRASTLKQRVAGFRRSQSRVGRRCSGMSPNHQRWLIRSNGVKKTRIEFYARGMSRWDYFPYVGGGKALAKKPLSVQLPVCLALASPWLVLGIVSTQRWALVLGGVWVVVPLVSMGRRRRAPRQP
jgi:hypothetical protein